MKTLIVAIVLTSILTSNAAPKAPPVMPPMPQIVQHRLAVKSPKAMSLASKKMTPRSGSVSNQVYRLLMAHLATIVQRPYFASITNQFDDFSHQYKVHMESGGLINNHSYVIERSPTFNGTNWIFVGSVVWGGPPDCCWPTDFPELSAFGNTMFFRIKDQGAIPLPAGFPTPPQSNSPADRPIISLKVTGDVAVYSWTLTGFTNEFGFQAYGSNGWVSLPVSHLPNGNRYATDAKTNLWEKVRLVPTL